MVDLETTGFAAGVDRIVEIAVLTVDIRGEPIRAWHTRINPGRPIPRDASRIHKLADADVAAAPTIDQVAGSLWALLACRVVIAHNAKFECSFLDEELPRPTGFWEELSICTLQLAQERFRRSRGTKLGECCDELGVRPPGDLAHTALGDTIACAGIFRRLPASRCDKQLEMAAAADIPDFLSLPAAPALPRPIPGISGTQLDVQQMLELTRLAPRPLPPLPTSGPSPSSPARAAANSWPAEHRLHRGLPQKLHNRTGS